MCYAENLQLFGNMLFFVGLFIAVDKFLRTSADNHNYAQNPVLNGNFDPNMPLAAVR